MYINPILFAGATAFLSETPYPSIDECIAALDKRIEQSNQMKYDPVTGICVQGIIRKSPK